MYAKYFLIFLKVQSLKCFNIYYRVLFLSSGKCLCSPRLSNLHELMDLLRKMNGTQAFTKIPHIYLELLGGDTVTFQEGEQCLIVPMCLIYFGKGQYTKDISSS